MDNSTKKEKWQGVNGAFISQEPPYLPPLLEGTLLSVTSSLASRIEDDCCSQRCLAVGFAGRNDSPLSPSR